MSPAAPQAAVATTKPAPMKPAPTQAAPAPAKAAPVVAAPAPAPAKAVAPVAATPTAPVQAANKDATQNPAASDAPQTAKSPAEAVVAAKPVVVDPLQLHAVEQGVLERTNAERARYGLRPLIIDHLLLGQARRHAAWMAHNRSMQHTRQAVAENIAMGQRSSTEVVQTWMNSSGHRANILNASYSRIGVAAYSTPEGSIFWCQQFLR